MYENDSTPRERRLQRKLRRNESDRRALDDNNLYLRDRNELLAAEVEFLEKRNALLKARVVQLEAELEQHRWRDLVAVVTLFDRALGTYVDSGESESSVKPAHQ